MELQEDNLLFKFNDEFWSCVLKYDDKDDKGRPMLAEYLNVYKATFGCKAVDFIGILEQKNLVLIEIKDFRNNETTNKVRVISGELSTEIATKVRDTIAAIVGANRTSETRESDCFKQYFSLLASLKKEIYVVLWCEGEFSKQFKAANYNQIKDLKEKLSWLTKRVYVSNRADNTLAEYLTVDYLKR
jgi:hypothetical protein